MRSRIIGGIFSLLSAAALMAAPSLVPLPQQMQTFAGVFTLCGSQPVPGAPAYSLTKILTDPAGQQTAEYLAGLFIRSTGYKFQIVTNNATNAVKRAILLTTSNANFSLGPEGYELTVAPDSVVIRAPSDAGLFYGVQSLLQLLPPEILGPRPTQGVAWTIPCVYIQDSPRFPWRGWMLDSVRHFFNKDEVKRLLDGMALNKLNYFHWHLDDDAGWRLEILKWPLLTQVGAWRTNIMFGLNPRSTTAWGDDGQYGGYYSQSDIREIVAYASQRHITVVPEIEMPGHSTAALAAYPQFSCNCTTCFTNPHSLNVTSYVGGVFCPARPETMPFLQDVLTEVMGLFPGPYIHIGGDEVNFSNWQNHSLDQALTNSLGITSMQQYQAHFTQGIANWIKSQGRTMIGWSEILNGGLVTNAALMDWKVGSASRATQMATNRQYVVMTPTTQCYINEYENSNVIWSNEPPGQSGFVPLSTVYALEPVPAGLSATFTNYILGAQGNNWSEYIPSFLNMGFKAYPRLAAIAELDWTPAAQKNFSSFTNRMAVHKQRLAQLGLNYNRSATPPKIGIWTQSQISTSYSPLVWDITTNVVSAGEIDVSFCYQSGANGLDIQWVALEENGVELDRDTHAGFTGTAPVKPSFVLRLISRRPGATYILRASVAGRGGTASNGTVFMPNWD